MSTISLLLGGTETAMALAWKSLKISEAIGQPDALSATLDGMSFALRMAIASLGGDQPLSCVVLRDADPLFVGAVLGIKKKSRKHVVSYELRGTGWAFLAPKRKVGVPDGSKFVVQEADDPDRVATAIFIDPNAKGAPTAAAVQALMANYWPWPQIDTTSYVTDILPAGADVDPLEWSGSDVEGALNDMAAAGSAAAAWWFAPDSPDPQSEVAPKLALHFGLVVLPDANDLTDGLLAGFPTADLPSYQAPFEIDNDNPDGTSSIMAGSLELDEDSSQRIDATYVRGGTGWSYTPPVFPPSEPGYYIATFSAATLIYARHESGYIGVHQTYGSAGLQVYVNPIFVPIDPVHLTGGHFWEIKTLTPTVYPAGWLIRQSDAKVSVVPVDNTVIPEHVTEGATGWVGLDRAWMPWGEEYLDAENAVTTAQKAALGYAFLASRNHPSRSGELIVEGDYHGWHKGQAVKITDADQDLAGSWFLIRSVEASFNDPFATAGQYDMAIGDTLLPSLGYSLRDQRLASSRRKIKPATQFIQYVGDLQIPVGGHCALTYQLANDDKQAIGLAGVYGRWHVLVDGTEEIDPLSSSAKFYLTNVVAATDGNGQVTATLNASTSATPADAVAVWVEMVQQTGV